MANVSLTSYASQLAEIDRQKRLANLLQTQAQEPIEIQSYKGTQAAIPLTSVLAKLLNQVGGQMKEARAIKREGELSAKDREVAQNLIGGRVSTAKISDIPQPRSLGVAMGELPQGPTPESRFMQQAQAAPMGELPQGPTPEARFMQRPGLTPEAQFMQRAAPQTIPSPGAMMNIPSQGAPMGMPPSAPPMGGPLRPPLPMMNIPPQAKDRARTPTEQIEAGQRALLDPMSGPLAQAMAGSVISRGQTKLDAADARALMLEDERRELRNKIYTSGPGDTSFTVNPDTGERTVINVNEKPLTVRSAIDPATGKVVSWTTDDNGKVTEVTSGEFTPTTEAEYNNLPVGAQYIGADGSTRVKT
tara:strand:+ start:4855 stop:5934 length:1080 start_codon:yes stop_codon:yes gene_type:complete